MNSCTSLISSLNNGYIFPFLGTMDTSFSFLVQILPLFPLHNITIFLLTSSHLPSFQRPESICETFKKPISWSLLQTLLPSSPHHISLILLLSSLLLLFYSFSVFSSFLFFLFLLLFSSCFLSSYFFFSLFFYFYHPAFLYFYLHYVIRQERVDRLE